MAELAALWGVSLTYQDATGRLRESPRDSVFEVIRALQTGTSAAEQGVADREDRSRAGDGVWLRAALDSRRAQVSRRIIEPVLVAWGGLLRLDLSQYTRATLLAQEEPEEIQSCGYGGSTNGASQSAVLGRRIPYGYHRLRVEAQGRVEEATVISAPRRCWSGDDGETSWGVFAPTYALRSKRDWGAGDLGDLEWLLDMVSRAGGGAVATLPLLASYLDRPFEPSPYSPVSRLFWNEFFLAAERSPEWSECVAARAVWESSANQKRIARWDSERLVDYMSAMSLKRRALEELSRHFFVRASGRRRDALETFVRQRPEVLAYAGFRARVEMHGRDWRSWPYSERAVQESPKSVGELSESARYHLYCQWLMEEQLRSLSDPGRSEDTHGQQGQAAGLFLDLPVGCHPGGFDVWRHQDLFAEGMSMGAPPDSFFSRGQNWGSPPLHPEVIRSTGHSHWSDMLRNHLRFAARLRIDHIMALHRLFWIPEGREPSEGVYVSYPTDELYAVLCLESHRHRARVTGEDLGTVPPGVRQRMRLHGVSSTWILQGGLRPRAERVIAPIPSNAVASLGTHDMFPLAGFLNGEDISSRLKTGQIGETEARKAMGARNRSIQRLLALLLKEGQPKEAEALLGAILRYLADSDAEFVLVGLDDLLLQHEPHNVPGSGQSGTNWRRRLEGDEKQVERVVREAARLLAKRGASWARGSSLRTPDLTD